MKRFLFILLIFDLFITRLGNAQNDVVLIPETLLVSKELFINEIEKYNYTQFVKNKCVSIDLFITVDEIANQDSIVLFKQNLYKFWSELSKIKRKSEKQELKHLKNIFNEIHKKYLHKYKINTNLYELVTTYNYDCLSATTLLALTLENQGFEYEVIETPVHVYIKVRLKNRDVILESTDKENGVISTDKDLAEAEIFYSNQTSENYKIMLQFIDGDSINQKFNNTIQIRQLIGLHYFNEAVEKYNNRLYDKSVKLLEKANYLYPSERVNGLLMMSLVNILTTDKIEPDSKRIFEQKYLVYQNFSKEVVISNKNKK